MKTTSMPVIELSGTPRRRGQIYGEAAKPLIANIVESWRADMGTYSKDRTTTKNIDTDTYLNEFLSETDYLSSINKWAPSLLEEVKGIAEGAGQDFKNILGLQLIDEEWIFGLRRGLNKATTKCTAFAVANQSEGISYAGQNMDIPSWSEGNQVLLRIMPTVTHSGYKTPEILAFTIAGNIGLNGLNSSAIGITCNTLAQLKYSTKGLPVSFIVRTILDCKTIDQAERLLKNIKHASGQNYILSSPEKIYCFECCATGVERYASQKHHDGLFHTNHPLMNQDESELSQCIAWRRENSEARLASITNRLGNSVNHLKLVDIKAALASHDDSQHPVSRTITPGNIDNAIGYTAGSSIYELTRIPRFHLAAGPPCETKFEPFEFNTNSLSVNR